MRKYNNTWLNNQFITQRAYENQTCLICKEKWSAIYTDYDFKDNFQLKCGKCDYELIHQLDLSNFWIQVARPNYQHWSYYNESLDYIVKYSRHGGKVAIEILIDNYKIDLANVNLHIEQMDLMYFYS